MDIKPKKHPEPSKVIKISYFWYIDPVMKISYF